MTLLARICFGLSLVVVSAMVQAKPAINFFNNTPYKLKIQADGSDITYAAPYQQSVAVDYDYTWHYSCWHEFVVSYVDQGAVVSLGSLKTLFVPLADLDGGGFRGRCNSWDASNFHVSAQGGFEITCSVDDSYANLDVTISPSAPN